jgi:membrane fusion protein
MSRQKLFRTEVIQAQRDRLLGSALHAIPLGFVWLTLLAAALAAAVILFMIFGRYTRFGSVYGRFVPVGEIPEVCSPTDGMISKIFVHDGQTIHRGERLVEITAASNNGANETDPALIAVQQCPDTRASGTQQYLADSGPSSAHQTTAIRKTLNIRQKEIRRLGIQLERASKSLHHASPDLATKHTLNQPTPLPPSATSSRRKSVQNTILRAPDDGIISYIKVKSGQSVFFNQHLFSIIPKDMTLQAQLLVPASMAVHVRPGSLVSIRTHSFLYPDTGQEHGQVTQIDQNPITKKDVIDLIGHHLHEPYYKVTVSLDHYRSPSRHEIRVAKIKTRVKALIELERHNLWYWVFSHHRNRFSHGTNWFLECNQQGAWGWLDKQSEGLIAMKFADALIERARKS